MKQVWRPHLASKGKKRWVALRPLHAQIRSRSNHPVLAAREIAEQRGEQGPLRVHHVHEAYQQLDREGRIPHRTPQQPLPLR